MFLFCFDSKRPAPWFKANIIYVVEQKQETVRIIGSQALKSRPELDTWLIWKTEQLFLRNAQKKHGTIPILRQQRDWVNGVRKMAIFADFQYADARTATGMDGTLHTDFRKSETSRDIKKKKLISFEHL